MKKQRRGREMGEVRKRGRSSSIKQRKEGGRISNNPGGKPA